VAGGRNDSGSRRGDPYREVVPSGRARFVLLAKRSLAGAAGIALIVLSFLVFVLTASALIWTSPLPFALRLALVAAAIALIVYSFLTLLRDALAGRRVEVDPESRVVRVYAPGLFGLPSLRRTLDFAHIHRVWSDDDGCVRMRVAEETIDVVDTPHACSPDEARALASTLHELVFGETMGPRIRIAGDEVDVDVEPERPKVLPRRKGWDE
jgi:hypothetical protein